MDTIVAIATGYVNSGVSIVRVSGEHAFDISQKCLNKIKINEMEERKMYLSSLFFGEISDKGLVVKFVAPFSFTGENIVEFHLHGGQKLAESAVDFLISSGARIAEPGEFSKRAFLNGKLSLESAEGIIDVINAESKAEINAGYNLMIGKLKDEIVQIQNNLTDIIAEVDVAIDYPEEDIMYKTETEVKQLLETSLSEIQCLLSNSKTGAIIKNGVQVCIIGKPNVGKSSLLNAVLNYDKAIVTDVEGTTRDIVEGSYEFSGVKFNLFDTAGIRESKNVVEQIGIDKSKQMLQSSDVILFILDGSKALDDRDAQVIDLLKSYKNKPLIIVENKTDLTTFKSRLNNNDGLNPVCVLQMSAKEKNKITNLKQTIFDIVFDKGVQQNALYISNQRHINCLKNAENNLKQALNNISNVSIDCVCLDIKNAWNNLGEITGKYITEEVVDAIFSKFCLGK